MSLPAVSVVIPIYNAGRYLPSAIGSMVEQTFTDWELICINDGSTDESGGILDWFAKQDRRIKVVHQSNGGIVKALNHGIELAQAALICRMDSDDLSMPTRLADQVEFMNKYSDLVAVSGTILEIDVDSEPLGLQHLPSEHEIIVQRLLTRETGLFHPASMMRTKAIRKVGGYRTQYQWIEDHDLWLRMSQIGQLGNMTELLLCYRLHPSSLTWAKSQRRSELMSQLMREAHTERGLEQADHFITATRRERSGAGPGKWARKAVRGGFPSTALKHLRCLWEQDGLSWYTLRMFAEVGLRLPAATRSHRALSSRIQVPRSTKWESAARNSCDLQP